MGKQRSGDRGQRKSGSCPQEIGRFFSSGPSSSSQPSSSQASKMAAARGTRDRSAPAPGTQVSPDHRSLSPHRSDHRSEYRAEHSSTHRSLRSRSVSNASLSSREGWDMETFMRSLPTKEDMDHYMLRLEDKYKQEMQDLKRDIGTRIDDIERSTTELRDQVQSHDVTLNRHTVMLHQLLYQQDDIENRNRRNNIRIRGLAESIEHKDLVAATLAIFNQLLQLPKDNHIELDRVHRTLGPRRAESSPPRDVLCRVHFYKMKEDIMKAARTQDAIMFNDSAVQLLPDLSRHTLQLQKALRPLLDQLRAKDIKYRWGYPFQLLAHHNGKSAVFRDLGDLPGFLGQFELPPVDLPDWPLRPPTPGFVSQFAWQTPRKRSGPRISNISEPPP